MQIDPLVVGIIRTVNSQAPGVRGMSDVELVQWYGAAAQPLADGIRAAIREEVLRVTNE